MSKKRRTLADFEDEAIAGLNLPQPTEPEPGPQPAPDSGVPAVEKAAPAGPAPQDRPARGARVKPVAGEWQRFSVRLTPAQFADARGAFIADVDNVPGCPDTFREWVSRAVTTHAHRTPAQRSRLAATLPQDVAPTRTCTVELPGVTLTEVDEATVAERKAGRALSRNAIIREALLAATEAARKRNGGRLQPITTRLPGRVSG